MGLGRTPESGHAALNAGFDACPAAYDELRDCWLNERRLLFLHEALRAGPSPANVIEIGSGTGWLLRRLAPGFPLSMFWGIEPLENYVEFSRRRACPENVRFVIGGAETMDRLDLPPADVILSNDVLHHVASLEGAVQAASRSASGRCRWIWIEPNWKNPYSFLRQAAMRGERVFWPRRFLVLAEAAGWARRSSGHLFLIPPFVKHAAVALRVAERVLERVPVLAGGVCGELEYRAEPSPVC